MISVSHMPEDSFDKIRTIIMEYILRTNKLFIIF